MAEGQSLVQLLQALLSGKSVDTTDDVTPLERAFTTAAGRDFLQLHESGGTEWFNKERFEELLEWLAIIALMELAAGKPTARTIATCLGRLAAENSRLTELAAHAGYRATLLLTLLKPARKKAETAEKLIQTKKPVRKKGDVQGATGTQTAKTADHKVPR
jgi:hypothetical protein